MLMTAWPVYLTGKRLLAANFGPYPDTVEAQIYFQPIGTLTPGVVLSWWGQRDPYGPEHLGRMRISLRPGHTVGTRRNRKGYVILSPEEMALEPLVPTGGTWADFFSIARQVAASRCDKMVLAGWIEEFWPHPWNLLVSENPVSLITELEKNRARNPA